MDEHDPTRCPRRCELDVGHLARDEPHQYSDSPTKLVQVGWLNPALTEPEDSPVGLARDEREFWEGYTVPVYRIVSGEEPPCVPS